MISAAATFTGIQTIGTLGGLGYIVDKIRGFFPWAKRKWSQLKASILGRLNTEMTTPQKDDSIVATQAQPVVLSEAEANEFLRGMTDPAVSPKDAVIAAKIETLGKEKLGSLLDTPEYKDKLSDATQMRILAQLMEG
jgi:hypothetical protein